MMDALLYAVRGMNNTSAGLWGAGFGYSVETCDIMPDGKPRPMSGDTFLAIHPGNTRSERDNMLFERYAFNITLTMKVTRVAMDRVGVRLLTSDVAQQLARKVGFNQKADQIRAFMHMNWGVLQDANQNLINFNPQAELVYGFCEPARFRGMDLPVWALGDHFGSEPDSGDLGLKAELRFADCLRFQAIATYL
jgi:hypothetical protein